MVEEAVGNCLMEKRNIKIAFYKEFGEQKIDLISLKRDEESSFKDYALLESVKLWAFQKNGNYS